MRWVAEHTEGEERPVRFDFYASTASRFYAPVALGIWCANWETGCGALGIPGQFAELKPEEPAAPAARPVILCRVPERLRHGRRFVAGVAGFALYGSDALQGDGARRWRMNSSFHG